MTGADLLALVDELDCHVGVAVQRDVQQQA